jgi:hypothetical protein
MNQIKSFYEYKIGDKSDIGDTIMLICGSTENIIVYINENNFIEFIYHLLKINANKIKLKLHSLQSKISKELPEKVQDSLVKRLGSVFYIALNANDENEAMSYFKDIEILIKNAKTGKNPKFTFYLGQSFIQF